MRNALAWKLSEKFSWLGLLLGVTVALFALEACSVDKSKYSFIPDDQFADASVSGTGGGEPGGGDANGGANPNGGDSGDNGVGGDSGANNGGANPNGGNMSGGTGNGACTLGEHNCTPDGHLQTCVKGNPPAFNDGVDCGGDGQCSASQGACLTCAPGTFQCASNVLQQCNIFGSAFEDTAVCDSKAACSAAGQKGFCIRCKAASSSCEPTIVQPTADFDSEGYQANRLVTCNTDGSGTDTVQVCEADSQVCDGTNKKCLRCQPNSYQCDGSSLNVCSADGSTYTSKAQCTSAAACDAVNGKCNTPKCTPNQYNCNGSELQSCGTDGAWTHLDNCDSAALCDSGNGRCQVCSTSGSTCANGNVQACDYNQGQYTPITTETCNPGTCTTSQGNANCTCKPSTVACYDGQSGYSVCGPGGLFGPYVSCPTDTVCSSTLGKCVTCVPGRFSCDSNGTVLKQCAADGSAYNTVENCQASNKFCDAGRGLCLLNQPGRFACGDNGDLIAVSYDSKHNVTSSTIDNCGTQNRCDSYNGICRPGQCTIGQTTCEGADVYTCATGDYRQRTTHCTTTTRCQDGFGCVKVLAIAAGDAHTCAIVAGSDAVDGDPGYALCWGANESGQLGDGSPLLADSKEARQVLIGHNPNDQSNSPDANTPRLGSFFTGICAGKNFSCAEIKGGDNSSDPAARIVACWGSNEQGQLGAAMADVGPFNGPFTGVTDDPANNDGLDLRNVTCGSEFACALSSDGTAYCWGSNDSGQLGTGSSDKSSIAAAAISGFNFTQITAGARHVCGVQADNTVWCWGDGSFGQLGNGVKKNLAVPTLIGKIAAAADRPLALGNDFTLALSTKASKNPYSWGANTFGQLATGSTTDSLAPVALAGLLSSDFVDSGTIYSGASAEHACARIADRLYCWGANVFGEVGDGSTDDRATPVQIFDGKTDATKLAPGDHSVAVGGRHTCAITNNGNVMCWGANHRYQLGTAALTPQRAPIRGY